MSFGYIHSMYRSSQSSRVRSSLEPIYGSGLSWNPDPNYSEVEKVKEFNIDIESENIEPINTPNIIKSKLSSSELENEINIINNNNNNNRSCPERF